MTDAVEAFKAEFGEAMAQAETFARRAERGLPADRWATTREMHLVAKGIRAQQALIRMQADVMLGLLAEMGADNANTAPK